MKSDYLHFLENAHGVIHVGANKGQEREMYNSHGLNVLWIEPIQEIFDDLIENIQYYPNQKALRYLITDKNNEEYNFFIANNHGASSSIFDFGLHTAIWPHVHFSSSRKLKSITLATMLENEGININQYDALIMDTQGSELLVLQGAANIINNFSYILTEVADFEAYIGCCQEMDITAFMETMGFIELERQIQKTKPEIGSYYNILYKRIG